MASRSETISASVSPLVSVIVPSYNYARFVGQTIESLQAQTYSHWECIIVDDGSTDNTAEVVTSFTERDPRIKFLRQQNKRQGAARNAGMQHSQGRYVQFLDADDLLENRKLERQVEYLAQHSEVDIVYGDVRFFETDRPQERLYTIWGENKPWQPGISGKGASVMLPLLRLNTIPINTALVRSDLIKRVGAFDESLHALEDWDYWLRCAAAGARFQFVDFQDSLALVRAHPTSWSTNNLRNAAAEVIMRRNLKKSLKDVEAQKLNKKLLVETEGTLGIQEVLHGSLARGVYLFLKAALFDRQLRHRLKWLSFAVTAPLVGKKRFEKFYPTSITRTIVGPLRQISVGGRR